MRLGKCSLTRLKQIDLISGGLLLALILLAQERPVLPEWMKWIVGALAAAAGLGIAAGALLPRERMDERAEKNERRADALLFSLLYTAAAIALLATLLSGAFVISSTALLVGFVAAGLARSAAFLLYERFGA